MPFSVYPIDILHVNDNYVWVITPDHGRKAYAVDPGAAEPVLQWLREQDLELGGILITHRHWDHVDGVDGLLKQYQVPVWGPSSAAIAQVTDPVNDGDLVKIGGLEFHIMAIPGHTREHIAYYWSPADAELSREDSVAPALFCGDTLFASGCGRVFDGQVEELYQSLTRMALLPERTRVFCAHEYTLANLKFAATVEPDNPALAARRGTVEQLRSRGQPSLPVVLADELQCNPFLRTHQPSVISSVSTHCQAHRQPGLGVFTALRRWKDQF